MGWGALVGIGRGLRSGANTYGRIMDEKRSQDFKLQQEEIQFERQKSLEALRNENQTARDQTQRGWQLEDQATKRQWDKEDRETDKEDKLEVYEAQKKLEVKYGMELAEQTYQFNKTAKDEEREQKAQELQEIFMEDGEISFQEKLAIASVKSGTDLSGFYKNNEGKPMSAEMLDKVSSIMMNNEKYVKMAEEDPMAFIEEAKKIGNYLGSTGGGGDGGGKAKLNAMIGKLNSMPEGQQLAEIEKIRDEQGPDAARMVLQLLGKDVGVEPKVEEDKESDTDRVKRMTLENQRKRGEPKKIGSQLKDVWTKLRTPNELER